MQLDITSIVLGALAIAFGIFTLVIRRRSPEKLRKLVAMEKQWGAKKGNMAHLIAYTVLPIVFGLIFIVLALLEAYG